MQFKQNNKKLCSILDDLYRENEGVFNVLVGLINTEDESKEHLYDTFYYDPQVKDNTHVFGLSYNIVSNISSLLKNIFLELNNSRGSYVILRSIIENHVVLRKLSDSNINNHFVELFNIHTDIMTYKMTDYYNNKGLKEQINEKLQTVYNNHIKKFSEINGLSIEDNPEMLFGDTFGWAYNLYGNKKVNFHQMLTDVGDEREIELYDICSQNLHISSYIREITIEDVLPIIKSALKKVKIELSKFNYLPDKYEYGFHYMVSVIDKTDKLYEIIEKKQMDILTKIKAIIIKIEKEPKVISHLITDTISSYYDVYSDFAFAFSNELKMKFRYFIELFIWIRYLWRKHYIEKDEMILGLFKNHIKLKELSKNNENEFNIILSELLSKFNTFHGTNYNSEVFIKKYLYNTFGFTIDSNLKPQKQYTIFKKIIKEKFGEQDIDILDLDVIKKISKFAHLDVLYNDSTMFIHASNYGYSSMYSMNPESIKTYMIWFHEIIECIIEEIKELLSQIITNSNTQEKLNYTKKMEQINVLFDEFKSNGQFINWQIYNAIQVNPFAKI